MRVIVAMLIVLSMSALASAISGIQSIHTDARLGTIVTYHIRSTANRQSSYALDYRQMNCDNSFAQSPWGSN
jgi:hypothetical protein